MLIPGQPWFLVLPSVYIKFCWFVLLCKNSNHVCFVPGGYEGRLFPGRTDPSVSRPAKPCRTPLPRQGPPRPDPTVVGPIFAFNKYSTSLALQYHDLPCSYFFIVGCLFCNSAYASMALIGSGMKMMGVTQSATIYQVRFLDQCSMQEA